MAKKGLKEGDLTGLLLAVTVVRLDNNYWWSDRSESVLSQLGNKMVTSKIIAL